MDALEKMHSDASGVVLDGDPSWPWLNSFEAVSGVVRGFAAEVVRDFGEGELGDYMEKLALLAQEMNFLFIGRGSAHFRFRRSVWNTPDQLGQHVLIALQLNGEIRWGVRDAFLLFADQLTDVLAEHPGEPIEKVGPLLDALCDRMTKILLGLPV